MKIVKWLLVLVFLAVVVFLLAVSYKQSRLRTWNLEKNEIIVHEGKFRPWPAGVKRLSLQPYFPFLDKMKTRGEFIRLLKNKKWAVNSVLSLEKSYIEYLTYKYTEALGNIQAENGSFQDAETFLAEIRRHIPDNLLLRPLEDSLSQKYVDFYFYKMVHALAKTYFYESLPAGGVKEWLLDEGFRKRLNQFLHSRVPGGVKKTPEKKKVVVPAPVVPKAMPDTAVTAPVKIET